MNNRISFVIRVKNEEKYLAETCSRIRKQGSSNLMIEIIIVDSGSTDNTLEIAEQYADKIINILPSNFTWGYALNKGISETTAEVICLLSGHCFIDSSSQSVESLCEEFVNSDFACLYGKQIGNRFLDKMEVVELAEQFSNKMVDSNNELIPGISNACCMIKKSVWEKYKYDEVVQSAEDGIWYECITKGGYKALYNPHFVVIHGHPFNPEYMFRKWYWRIYKSEIILGRNLNWKTSNHFRFFLAFLKGMFFKSVVFYKYSKNVDVNITLKSCLYYFYIRELASYKAKIDIKNNLNNDLKYECLKIPNSIKYITRCSKPGVFYDI